MRDFWIIFVQAFKTKAQTKSFIWTTVIVIAAIFLMANLSTILDTFKGKNHDKDVVYVNDVSGEIYPLLEQQLKETEQSFTIKNEKLSEDEMKQKIENGDIAGYVELKLDAEQTIEAKYLAESLSDYEISTVLENALQSSQTSIKAKSLQLSQAQVSALFAPIKFEKQAVSASSKSQEELSQARGLVYVLIFVIYFSVFYYSNMIAMEVATEKSSRVMEVLISSVSPVKHMFAKIAGVGTLGLLQIALYGVAGFTALKTSSADLESGIFQFFGFSNVSISTIIFAILFFLLGYFLYATLAALLGSLVSRIEDVQSILMPMTFIIIIASFLAFSGLGNPEATYITVTSYIPFFAPLVMFLRVGMLDLPIWEPIVSVSLLVVTIAIIGWFGSRVYKGGVLMYGASKSFKDIKKALQLGKK